MRSLNSCVFLLWLVSLQTATALDLSRPNDFLGPTDNTGRLSSWHELATVKCSNGTKLPLRGQFSWTRKLSPTFGFGWWLPLLESTTIKIGPGVYQMTTLGGKIMYFSGTREKGVYESQNRLWRLEEKLGDVLEISNGEQEFLYVGGKLQRARLSPSLVLNWKYNGADFVSLSEENGRGLIEAERLNPRQLSSLRINETRYPLTFAQIPVMTQKEKLVVISGFVETLASFGESFRAAYETTPAAVYTAKFERAQAREKKVVWSGLDGKLIADETWTYTSDGVKSVSRSAEGKKESYTADGGIGRHVRPDGSVVERSYFMGSSPNFGKVRKRVTKVDGKEVYLKNWSYDEAGKVIREVTGDTSIRYEYHPNGKLAAKITEQAGKVISSKRFDSNGKVVESIFGENRWLYSYEGGREIVKRFISGQEVNYVLKNVRFEDVPQVLPLKANSPIDLAAGRIQDIKTAESVKNIIEQAAGRLNRLEKVYDQGGEATK